MRIFFNVTETEQEVLEKLWDQEGSIKQSQLLTLFEADGKEWKRQTLNTFLSRLEDKGLIRREKRMVQAVYDRETYHNMQMKEAINHIYGGKLSNFMASFVKANTIDESEAAELIKIIENN